MAPEILVDTVHKDHCTEAQSAIESTSDGIEWKICNTPLFHSSFLVAPGEHQGDGTSYHRGRGHKEDSKLVSVLLENVNPGSHIGPKWI